MLTYHAFSSISEESWLRLLNSALVRKHLVQHPLFTPATLGGWLLAKIEEDQNPGCKIRAMRCDGDLAGWCGIQRDSGNYELALVLSPDYWGRGREVMSQVFIWAQELGHKSLLAHLPQTRPQTRAIRKLLGQPIGITNIQGHRFNTHLIEIENPANFIIGSSEII